MDLGQGGRRSYANGWNCWRSLGKHGSNKTGNWIHNAWQPGRTWTSRNVQLKSLLFLASSLNFILKAVENQRKVFSSIVIWPRHREKIRKKYGGGEGTNVETSAVSRGRWWGNVSIWLNQSPSTSPCMLAFRIFYSTCHEHLKATYLASSESNCADHIISIEFLPYARHSSKPLHLTNYVILITVLWGKYYYYLNFREKKKERNKVVTKKASDRNLIQMLFLINLPYCPFASIIVYNNTILGIISFFFLITSPPNFILILFWFSEISVTHTQQC